MDASFESGSTPPAIGQKFYPEETFCYIGTLWGTYDRIPANFSGRIVEVCVKQGAHVSKGDILAYIERIELFA